MFTVVELADRLGGRVVGDGAAIVTGVNSLDVAQPHQISFIGDPKHAKRWIDSRAGAAVVTEGLEVGGQDRSLIFVPNAELAMAAMLELFRPPDDQPDPGVHPTAFVHESVTVAAGVRIGPHVSVGRECTLEANVVLHAGVRLYEQVQIGADSVLHSNAVVRSRCRLGRRVILHQNSSIGADGFGYRPAADGSGLVKVPHVGIVVLGDDVEIGAGTCVDRAKFGSTTIGDGTKIDNLVQVAHNCQIGRGCVIAALTGISGSVTLGDGVQVGGGVGIADHINVGKGAKLGAHAGVISDVPAGETWYGFPADRATATLRQWAAIRKLPGSIQRMGGAAEVVTTPPHMEPLGPSDQLDRGNRSTGSSTDSGSRSASGSASDAYHAPDC